MSKSILVIDTPENCTKCALYHYPSCRCYVTSRIQNNISDDFKPDWCPIRDLPRRKIFLGLDGASNAMEIRERGRQEGFNACIDEILKGANGNE